ncbi:MAG: DUF1926 domain-containing protein [FCB group bacterium]|nr:DUF1926 domain-containing protein [FCB group bacterium]
MKFIFGIHNHQPVGNFDAVFEEAYQKSYLPFLDLISKYQEINFSLHVSGPLLEWLEKNHSDYIDRVGKLVADDRCEILSSGFYEPILIAISDRDKVGQIEMMNAYIEERFGKTPEGLWLTERVWEPGLVKPIVRAGIKYIAVDDQHFSASNGQLDELDGYYLTEDQGYVLGVFPISQKLRYAIPFEKPDETLAFLQANAKDRSSVRVMADDGEKFGVWPGTWEHCFGEDDWLNSFFKHLTEAKEWLQTLTFSQYFNANKPRGRVYLPTSSYFEMSEWTLPLVHGKKYSHMVNSLKQEGTFDDLRPFLRGGTWRDFLTKYEESNWMMKRANYVSTLMNGQENESARKAIWRSQCNCGYWHGIFGGLYLPHLRHAIYENIIAAENLLATAKPRQVDIDKDGTKEVILANRDLRVIFTPHCGAIRELDIRAKNFNIVNTFARHEENYHEKLFALEPDKKGNGSIHDRITAKEEHLEDYLYYDTHPRWMLIDHFFSSMVKPEQLQKNRYTECGDLVATEYEANLNGNSIVLIGSGHVNSQFIEVKKMIRLKGAGLKFKIHLRNLSDDRLKCFYAPEFNFSLLGGHTADRFYQADGNPLKNPYLDSTGMVLATVFSLITEWEGIECQLKFEGKTKILRYPVQTVSMSESGFEKIYQSSVVLPVWPVDLEPQEGIHLNFDLNIITTEGNNGNT